MSKTLRSPLIFFFCLGVRTFTHEPLEWSTSRESEDAKAIDGFANPLKPPRKSSATLQGGAWKLEATGRSLTKRAVPATLDDLYYRAMGSCSYPNS